HQRSRAQHEGARRAERRGAPPRCARGDRRAERLRAFCGCRPDELTALVMVGSLVRLDGVSKTYGTDAHVLRDVSIEFPRGQLISLTGASGSGKSTLISLLAGLAVPDAGRVIFDGDDIAQLDDVARARLRAQRIGIVLQSGNLIPFLTA